MSVSPLHDFSKALSFNGSSDYATTNFVPSTSGFGIAFRVRKNGVQTANFFILSCVDAGQTNGINLIINADVTKITWNIKNGASNASIMTFPSLNNDEYYHIVLNYVQNGAEMFLDGKSVGTNASITMTQSTNAIKIARRADSAAGFTKIYVDDLVMRNGKVFSKREIDDMIYKGVAPVDANYFDFNDVTTDKNVNGGTCALTGSSYSTTVPNTIVRETIAKNLVEPLDTYGDSVTAGSLASSSAFYYVTLLSAYANLTLINHGIGGSKIADMLIEVFKKTVISKSQSSIMVGYNDMNSFGTDSTHLGYFNESLYSALAYLGTPKQNKRIGQDSRITYSGTWSNSAEWSGTVAKESSTETDTATFYLYGSVLYISLLAVKSGTGVCSVTVDGASQGSVNCFNSDTSSLGFDHHCKTLRITGLGKGVHKVVITVTTAGRVSLVYGAGNEGINIVNSPDVYVGNCLQRLDTATFGAAVTLYNSNISTVVNNLISDGLNLTLVDVGTLYTPTVASTNVDALHPNDIGHGLIADIFIASFKKYKSRVSI